MTKWFSLGAIAAILLPVVGCVTKYSVSGGSEFNLDTSSAEVQPPVQPSENIDDYFTLTRGPIDSAQCGEFRGEPFRKYEKSQAKGERQINRLLQKSGEASQFRLYADSTWYDVSKRECKNCIDNNMYDLVVESLAQSGTQKVTFYSNTHYHGWSNDETKRAVLSEAESPIARPSPVLNLILELKERFEEVDYRVVTPSGVYVLELNDDFYSITMEELRAGDLQAQENINADNSFINEAMNMREILPSSSDFREKLGVDANASYVDENLAFCEYLNANQDIWTFSFKPINSPQTPTSVPVE
jgi:hypothetical protein